MKTWISTKLFDVAKNGGTGEKRKPYQRNQVMWIYCFLSLQRQGVGSYYFVFFWITQGCPSRASPYFLSKKYIAFSSIRKYVRDMEFRRFYLFVRPFVCNLKNSFTKLSHYTFQSFKHFSCWLSDVLVVDRDITI